MRWLLIKDLQILRRSPLLVGTLVVYPIAIALMIGFALASPAGKPKVAIYNGIPAGHQQIAFGSERIDVNRYARQLYSSIDPIHASSPASAIADVRDGRALAALLIPADLPEQIQSLMRTGTGSPAVRLVLNDRNPLERQVAQQAIQSRITQAQQAISKQVLAVAVGDLQEVLNGGHLSLLGQTVPLLGLRNSRAIVSAAIDKLPPHFALTPALRQVTNFAGIAIDGLTFASPVLGSIGSPLTVHQSELSGRTTPTSSYAVAIAAMVSLMFVTLLLGAGMLALERSENAYLRLVRGLVRPEALITEKIALAAACGAVVTLAMSAVVSIFVSIDWTRFGLWLIALALAGLAFAALGVAIGAIAREVSTASLLSLMVSLPIAFLALVPSTAVSSTVAAVLKAISFVFPFRAGLEAVSNAFTGTAPGIGLPLLHLALLTVAFAALARVSVGR